MIEVGVGGFALAFAAGFVSFTSPCMLPVVPGYLSLVSGVGFEELRTRTRRVVSSTAAFAAGFTAIFIAFGAGAAWFGNALIANRRALEIAAGAVVILVALTFVGLRLPRPLLVERHVASGGRPRGPVTAAAAGVAFAIGWTPCIGPTLAAILTLSAAGSSATEGAVLLAVYSLGLAVPFLLFGLLFTRALALVRWLRDHRRAVSLASAAILTAFGVLLISGDLVRVTTQLARFTGWQI